MGILHELSLHKVEIFLAPCLTSEELPVHGEDLKWHSKHDASRLLLTNGIQITLRIRIMQRWLLL